MLNVLGKTARCCTLGLKGLGLGFPGHDIQRGCVLLPTGILITVLYVANAVPIILFKGGYENYLPFHRLFGNGTLPT